VKASYAGQDWSSEDFAARLRQAREQLAFLGRRHPQARQLPRLPGAGGDGRDHEHALLGRFSAQSIASKSSPLQKLYNGDHAFSPLVSLDEKSAAP
jgi:hypothetical protein